MSKNKSSNETEEVQETTATVVKEASGTRAVRTRRALTMKNFVPDIDWINQNVVSKGKGAKAFIGRVFGIVTGTEIKEGKLPNGDPSKMVVCRGVFESENYLDGEVSEFSAVFFPNAFADRLHAMFEMDSGLKSVEIDCDVGIEATGKSIPYSWVIVNNVEDDSKNPLHRLRISRQRPKEAAKLLAPPA